MECCNSFEEFSAELTQNFDPLNPETEAVYALQNLTQGSRLAINYIIEFKTADCGWEEKALIGTFYRDLSERIKDALTAHKTPKTLQSTMGLVQWLDNRFHER